MHQMCRRIYWALAISIVSVTAQPASAESLIEWLRNRRSTVVNVYVPPVAGVPSAVPTVTTARPIIVYPPGVATQTTLMPGATTPTVVPPPAASPATVTTPTVVAQPPVVPSAVAATPVAAPGYTVQYRARTRYRTTWVQVPVTVYRPTTTVDPVTQATTTALQPCQSYTWQVRRVPVTEWKPIRVLPGPPPTGAIPAVTVPAASTTIPAAPPATSGWPTVSPPPSLPSVPPSGTPALPTSPPPVSSSGTPMTTPLPPAPAAGNGNGADVAPRLSPEDAQRLQKPEQPQGRESNGAQPDPSRNSNDHDAGPALTPPVTGQSNQPASAGPTSSSESRLQPIPRTKSHGPVTQPPRHPRDLADPPALLDPRDPIALRSDSAKVVPTAFRSPARQDPPSTSPSPALKEKRKPLFSTKGWYSVNPRQ